MKYRCCHVSNSSSSSFILHKSEVTEEQWNGLLHDLKELDVNPPQELVEDFYDNIIDEWGESGRKYKENGNYLFVETYYISDQFNKICDKYNIDRNKALEDYR